MSAFRKVLPAAGLLLLAWCIARYGPHRPGFMSLLAWMVLWALLEVLFHRPYPPRGKSRFLFTTPLVVFGGACVLGGALLESGYWATRFNWTVSLAGDLLFAGGLALRISAQRALGGLFHYNIRLVEGHSLVTGGVFRHMRHPSYTGLLLMGLAAPLVGNAYWAFLAFPIFLASILVRVHYEEEALREAFPEYPEYAGRTACLVPGLY